MDQQTALLWSWMNVLTAKRYTALVDVHGSLDAATKELSFDLLRNMGMKEDSAMKAMNRAEEMDVGAYDRELQKRDLVLLTVEDEGYPEVLRTLPDFPVFLYARGELSILQRPCISLVGARAMTEYGELAVSRLVPDFVQAGVTTVSGLAEGIDAEVARETLRANGSTVAVLGHGFGTIYPKHHATLAEEIVQKGALILSEYPLDVQPDRYTFPARNRIIAGLSLATIVVEAAEDSGSLITADLALDYGREVAAVPGRMTDPGSFGCHRLISTGQAKLIQSADDLLSDIGIVASTRAREDFKDFDSSEEEVVYNALTTLPASTDDVAMKAKLDAAALNAILTILELKGAAKKLSGGSWVRH